MHAAIQGIPEEAAKRGVFPEDALRERFLKVITAFPVFLKIMSLSRIQLCPTFAKRSRRSKSLVAIVIRDLNKRIDVTISRCNFTV